VDPSFQSVNNPAPDFYGEKVSTGSTGYGLYADDAISFVYTCCDYSHTLCDCRLSWLGSINTILGCSIRYCISAWYRIP
jgi:hypothetical protein